MTTATSVIGLTSPVSKPSLAALPLAHQGGWDEILLVVAPLAVIGLMLWIANKRVSAQIAAGETAAGAGANTAPAESDKSDGNGGHVGS